MARETHDDDGTGRCYWCYEEWPCSTRRSGSSWGYFGGIHEWELNERNKLREAERQERLDQETRINELLAELGLDIEWPRESRTIAIRIEDFTKLLNALTRQGVDQ